MAPPLVPCHFCGGSRTEILSMSIKNRMMPACGPCKEARRSPHAQRKLRRNPCAECGSPRLEDRALTLQRNGTCKPLCATCYENLRVKIERPAPDPVPNPVMMWGELAVEVLARNPETNHARCKFTLGGVTKIRLVPLTKLRPGACP